MSNTKPCSKKTSIGGQALIEGIMMRGPHKTVMSVRLPDGTISTEPMEFTSSQKPKILKLPVIRGVVNLIESLITGYKALMLSAERSGMLDDEVEKTAEVVQETDTEPCYTDDNDSQPAENDNVTFDEVIADTDGEDTVEEACESIPTKQKENKAGSILISIVTVLSAALGVGLALILFMYLPHAVFTAINNLSAVDITAYQALFEGVLKLLIFVGYMFAVSFMKDIKRVFMYHGAEHKTIFCYEKGLELTVENVREQKRFHPRCGTSFLILMLIVSIFVCQLLLFIPAIKVIATSNDLGFKLLWVLIKILTLPLVCGLGYELIKFCGRKDNIITKIIAAPGLWLQRISTKEPDDSMIEVAIESIKAVIPENSEDDCW